MIPIFCWAATFSLSFWSHDLCVGIVKYLQIYDCFNLFIFLFFEAILSSSGGNKTSMIPVILDTLSMQQDLKNIHRIDYEVSAWNKHLHLHVFHFSLPAEVKFVRTFGHFVVSRYADERIRGESVSMQKSVVSDWGCCGPTCPLPLHLSSHHGKVSNVAVQPCHPMHS